MTRRLSRSKRNVRRRQLRWERFYRYAPPFLLMFMKPRRIR